MNSTLVYLPEGTRPEPARNLILKFEITSVPVLNDAHQPVGTIALRDLGEPAVGPNQLAEPSRTIGAAAPIQTAAYALVSANVYQLVVVDPSGRSVGILSALDVIRALIGLEPRHPDPLHAFR